MTSIALETHGAGPAVPSDREAGLQRALDVCRSAFHAIVNESADGVVVVNLNGTICFVNEAAERILGRKTEELLGESFGVPVAPGERAEVRILKQGVPARIAEIRAVRTEWQGHEAYLASLRDVTHLKQAEESVRRELRERDDFLATLSHELRNPLAAISHAVQTMNRASDDPKLNRQGREIIERQSHQMTQLLDDLMDVASASRGRIELHTECLDLTEVLAEAVEAATALMRHKNHELVVQLPDEPVYVDGDPVRLHQVFVNLLNNAAKYTDSKGHVWLTLFCDDGEPVVSVRDDGIGMSPEVQAAVFEPFVQIRNSLTRSEGGLGIGLSLVKSLVELHGGRVTAGSEGPGLGSEFEVRLPIATGRPRGSAAENDTLPESQLRILLVEDNADVRHMLQLALELDGHEVESAADGTRALELIEFQRPDAVILDIGLPDLDGCEVARLIRANPEFRNVRLLALSGYSQTSDQDRSLAAGFDAHLSKPVDLDELSMQLAALVQRGVQK
jgi:signal transduction histidine kinase/ActR/RegA family two-component response regulator